MLGAIADDFTGATDLATMLRRSGHRVAVVIEDGELDAAQLADLDAVVIALKTRTAPRDAAVAATLAAIERLRAWGATRYYDKYCSTFDSTDAGNIGPILDAATDATGATRAVVVPSLPSNGRTVRGGDLYVGNVLLEDSPMRHHPLTPMTKSRVAEILRPQTPHEVGEIGLDVVRGGVGALSDALAATSARYVVVDAVDDADLAVIGAATARDVLVSGGSGLALGIDGPKATDASPVAALAGRRLVLAGSVSAATRGQIAHAAKTQPVRLMDLEHSVLDVRAEIGDLLAWVRAQDALEIPVVCAALEHVDVRATVLGTEVAPLVERVLATLAKELTDSGEVTALIVAGGESSGAVVRELGIPSLRIGAELAPGVCWAAGVTSSGRELAIALKSGNFGAEDLFTSAWEVLA
jgi:uncharacterized protein YgbK (DUF1537 family)